MPEKDKKAAGSAAAIAEAKDEPTTVEFGGVTYTVDPDSARDVELVEALAELNDGNALMMPRIVRSLLGPKQYDAFKEARRDPKTGRVPMEALTELFGLIDAALGE